MVKIGYKQTDIGIIPEDWEVKQIKDFADGTAGGTPSTQINSFWGGNIKWMNSGELNNKIIYDVVGRITEEGLNNSSTKLIPENCILIGLAGQGKTRGTVAINKVPLCTNQSIAAIYPNEKYESLYLFYNLEYRYFELRSMSTGDGGRGGLNLTIIRNILIPIPEKKEQKAIANALSDVDDLITAVEKLIAKKESIKTATMQQLLTGKKRLDGFSGKWEEKKLGEIAIFRRGSFPQPYGLSKWYDETNGAPFIQVYDVDKNMKLKSDTKQHISDIAKNLSVFVKKDTVILTIQGSIGRIAITQYDAYIDRTLLIFTNYLIPMDTIFFSYAVQELFRIEKEKAAGGTIKTITKEELSNFTILVPILNEQQAIAQILSDMDNEIEALKTKLSKTKAMKDGMMSELLNGKTRLKV